ncbi:hypothetical protein EOM39_03345 [Candidatus Gracilibacteria bacterium]|nr:hypothetical protein [Candidatus Gracilibacteria bacterium]
MNTLVFGFVIIFLSQTAVICYMVHTLKEVTKIVKSSTLTEYEELKNNGPLSEIQPKPRFIDVSELYGNELSELDIDPQDIYKGVIFKEDTDMNKKENIIS